jgi:hypothetical protein
MRSNDAAARRRELDDTAIKRSDVIKVTCREQAVPDKQADLFDPVRAGFLSWEGSVN